ncbi:hypothetical protein H072_5836 [Dactylellina haptotyla CBS 200.50]|uniref:Zn(2)-C6 fungal-type domain-containing protein n=1 Tax=Dactylellina haptotyla (strain CBS 200.50) TaxID=1284197 RepID=S8ABM6_DACHA|nr:hypothetical protein H072_5836 [Dactylellina haptotyla CBS 200.50]
MPKRACDGCSIRKIRCEGVQPCRACSKAGLPCTFLKALRKGGPRKPTARTIEAIKRTQEEYGTRDYDAEGIRVRPPSRSQPSISPSSNPVLIEDDTEPESSEQTPLGSPLRTFQNPGAGYLNGGTVPGLGPSYTYLEAEQDGIGLGHGLSAGTKYPTPVLAIYLEIYHHRLYPVWPIVKWEPLLAELEARPNDPEIYALGTALASAVMGQLQLPQWTQQYVDPETQITKTIIVSTEHFAAEALRARRLFEWRERPGIYAILTSLFFHVYYENLGKTPASSLALREAITFVQIMNLDRESGYQGLSPEDAELRRRLFWLLFVTERGHSIVHDLPFVLNKTIKLPSPDIDKEPLLASFMNLASLFANFDKSVIDAWTSRNTDDAPSLERLKQLQTNLKEVHPHKMHTNEVQKADVLVTKHWMRTLVWQVSMQQGFLAGPSGKDENDAMTLAFPLKIAEELLSTLSNISRGAIESHGPGMQSKLFEITNSLADVILCIPNAKASVSPTSIASWAPTPVDYLKSLVDLLHFRTSSNPQLLRIILSKTSSILLPPDPLRDQRLLELPSSTRPSPESPPSNEATPTQTPIADKMVMLPIATPVLPDTDGIDSAALLAAAAAPLDLDPSSGLVYPPVDMMEYTTTSASPTTPTAAPIVSNLNSPVVTPPTATNRDLGQPYFPATYGTQELLTSAPPGLDVSWILADDGLGDWTGNGDTSGYMSDPSSAGRSQGRRVRNWMDGINLSQSASPTQ